MNSKIKLDDIIAMLNKEQGFYIRSAKTCEIHGITADMYYSDSDSFYEDPYSKQLLESELMFISTLDSKLLVIIE